MRNPLKRFLIIVALLSLPIPSIFVPSFFVHAQDQIINPPVEMMVLIDNSCSMFPANQIRPDCDAFGSDPTFLRITGASTFIARLGFAEPNEEDFRLGIIEVGDEPQLLSPLIPLSASRDVLAELIADPEAQPGNRFVPALEMAYGELRRSIGTQNDSLPAIILITDGVPYPREGQSEEDITRVLDTHPEIPLFIMLLQNRGEVTADYAEYIAFWQKMAARNANIVVYQIHDANEIQDTYNLVLGQLQNTVPVKSVPVKANTEIPFFIHRYHGKVVITVVRRNIRSDTRLEIIDPQGNPVQTEEDGVAYFKSAETTVEVFSITQPRLRQELRGQPWTLRTHADATVMIDRQGSYRMEIVAPDVSASEINHVYRAVERQSPSRPLSIRFNLVDDSGQPVLEEQAIRGTVLMPDGKETPLVMASILRPDATGMYELIYDAAKFYPQIMEDPGRFTFSFEIGKVDGQDAEDLPLTTARLVVDMGLTPYIRSIAPVPVICEPGQPAVLRVSLGDITSAAEESLQVKAISGNTAVEFGLNDVGVYEGDLTSFCRILVVDQLCSSQKVVSFTVQLEGMLPDNTPLAPASREVQAQVIAPQCTPTPEPTPTPTLVPTPSPVPDGDGDGINDASDRCPTVKGWEQTGGCIPWNWITMAGGALGLVLFSTSIVWPWIRVKTFSTPPDGYLVAVSGGKVIKGPVSFRSVGMSRRKSRLAVGSDRRRVDIHIEGLRPVEFFVERRQVLTALREPGEPEPFAYLEETPRTVHTGDPQVLIKVGLDEKGLSDRANG